jgi:mRNA-degrading endonuclease toxin of MazEF toxin-antitoxin module
MAYPQGAIVLATDPFGNAPKRPYVVLSNSTHPFHGQEYVAAVITTTERHNAIELTPERIERGSLPRRSFVSPWSVTTLKDAVIDTQPAQVTGETVDDTRRELNKYLEG